MDSHAPPPNGFLKSLSTDDFEAIRPHLRSEKVSQGQVLQELGDPIRHVYFPHDCILSRILELDSGHSLDISLIGPDSLLGALAAAGVPAAKTGAVAVLPGITSIIDTDRLRAAAEQSKTLSKALARHGQAVLARAQQVVSCKALHSVEARLARWLLEVRALSGSDRFMLSPEMMAQMIGARSNSIAIVAHTLELQGCISCSDGRVEITDPARLAQAACNCYSVIRTQHENLLRDVEQSIGRREIPH